MKKKTLKSVEHLIPKVNIPVAQRIAGTVQTFGIVPAMVEWTLARASAAGVKNVTAALRDVLAAGFGLADQTCDACLLFNILHCPKA